MSLRIEKSMLNLENIVTKDKKYVEDYCYSKGVTLAFRSSAKFFLLFETTTFGSTFLLSRPS